MRKPLYATTPKALRLGTLAGGLGLSVALVLGTHPGQGAEAAPGAGERRAENADSLLPIGRQELVLPLLEADGHVAVGVTIYNSAGLKELVALELALEDPCVVSLHSKVFAWLDVPTPGSGLPPAMVKLAFAEAAAFHGISSEELQLIDDSRELERQDSLTARYSAAFQERKLKGKLGLGFLRKFRADIDLHSKQLRLTPRSQARPEEPVRGAIVAGFVLSEGRLALPLRAAGDETAAQVVLGSLSYEAKVLAASASAPLVLESTPALDLKAHFACRAVPRLPLEGSTKARSVALLGSDFLDAYRVLLDWDSSTLQLVERRASRPAADLTAYFSAADEDRPEAYGAFLEKYPKGHFAPEAARRLLELRLKQPALSSEELTGALRSFAETHPPERRTEECLPVLEALASQGRPPELVVAGCKLALEYARAATHIQDVYRTHRVLGLAYFESGDLDSAWRHLLSAGFVKIEHDPDHAFLTAYYLGCVYERQGRLSRAYSRFKTALSVREPGWSAPASLKDAAEEALERLRGKLTAEQLGELDQL